MGGPTAEGPDVAGLMGTVEVLGEASRRGREALAAAGRLRRLPKGSWLFQQGDPGDHVFVLVEGRIEISSVANDGRRQLHTSLLPPRLFGELGPLAGEPRTAAALALQESLVWSAPLEAFDVFLATEPAAGRALIRDLARQAVAAGAMADDLRGLDLRGRVAKRLLSLVTPSFDRLPPDGVAIPALVTQADLASLANGSREQVTRILGELQRAGAVGRQGRRIVLTDVAALARLAALPNGARRG